MELFWQINALFNTPSANNTLRLIALFALLFIACDTQNPGKSNADNKSRWLVNSDFIFDGGVGKEGIQSIDNPSYLELTEAGFMSPQDLVLVLKLNGTLYVYPHKILDYHEIVNTNVQDSMITVSYCPLTGTGYAWPGDYDMLNTEFGVSGLLYNNNLIMYDRQTNNNWSQMRSQGILGSKSGEIFPTLPLIETTWETTLDIGIDKIKVLSPLPNRTYNRYPYGQYRTADDYILFPVEIPDDRVPAKERVLVIANERQEAMVYRQQDIIERGTLVQDGPNVILSFKEKNLMLGFVSAYANGDVVEFEKLENQYPDVLKDQAGNIINVFGEVTKGPRVGDSIKPLGTMAYFFNLSSIYDLMEIYGNYKPLEDG